MGAECCDHHDDYQEHYHEHDHHHHGHGHDDHHHHGDGCCWDASWLIYWVCGCMLVVMYGMKYNSIEGSWKFSWNNKDAAWFWFVAVVGAMACVDPKQSMEVMVVGTIVYGLYGYWNQHVSKPGGPRPHKIVREPQWTKDKSTELPNLEQYECLVDVASHQETLAGTFQLPLKSGHGEDGLCTQSIGLSGEPAGRQTWTRTSVSGDAAAAAAVDSDRRKVALEWARGGREKAEAFNPSANPNSCDVLYRSQHIYQFLQKHPDFELEEGTDAQSAVKRAVQFYQMLQAEDGHWAADYGGPHFLLPGLVIAWYIMGRPPNLIAPWQAHAMAHYLQVHQQSDGGWGSHIESPSTMFGTVLCYVALRLLYTTTADKQPITSEQTQALQSARDFIQGQPGGALCTGSWAKFWLCLLGCMEWEGHNCVPPEMWLLPDWFPFHPGRLWCHCRMVYLPMGYLYGTKFVYPNANHDPLIQQLRTELYTQPYHTIPWNSTRHDISPLDNYSPIPWIMKTLQNILAIYEKHFVFQAYRKQGIQFSYDYMCKEDLQTNFIDIGPVNKVLNMLSMYHASSCDLKNPLVIKHMMRVPDYLWMAEDGMKMQGYNGSSCWDTSFAIQAIAEANLLDDFPTLSQKVWSYLEKTQILSTPISQASPAYEYEKEEKRIQCYRHVSKGGWPFSTSAHGWPISDCTGEGLKGVLVLLQGAKTALSREQKSQITEERLYDAVNVLLSYQNVDGGWATYENNRGFGWYEQLNPSEVFGDIMIDYSYVECSMASMTGLAMFHDLYPYHRTDEIQTALIKGRDFIKRIQREDGSWYGSWACCFCYGCWFGVEGLMMTSSLQKNADAGSSDRKGEDCPEIQKCIQFLLSHQNANGGWGEDFTSCYDKDYAKQGMKAYGDEEGSGVVNTSWALLALSIAKCKDIDAVRKGVHYLMQRQLPSGDWPQEGISGVFNRSIGITYTAYRNVFPIWALARCIHIYGNDILSAPLDDKQ